MGGLFVAVLWCTLAAAHIECCWSVESQTEGCGGSISHDQATLPLFTAHDPTLPCHSLPLLYTHTHTRTRTQTTEDSHRSPWVIPNEANLSQESTDSDSVGDLNPSEQSGAMDSPETAMLADELV